MAEVAIYGAALTAARVAAHFAAADLATGRPVYKANGTFDITLGSAVGDPASTALILASVRKAY